MNLMEKYSKKMQAQVTETPEAGPSDTPPTPVERVAYRIYSNILQAFLWVVQDDAGAEALRSEGISEPIYTGHEIAEFRGLCSEDLRAVHSVKQVFENSKIESYGPEA